MMGSPKGFNEALEAGHNASKSKDFRKAAECYVRAFEWTADPSRVAEWRMVGGGENERIGCQWFAIDYFKRVLFASDGYSPTSEDQNALENIATNKHVELATRVRCMMLVGRIHGRYHQDSDQAAEWFRDAIDTSNKASRSERTKVISWRSNIGDAVTVGQQEECLSELRKEISDILTKVENKGACQSTADFLDNSWVNTSSGIAVPSHMQQELKDRISVGGDKCDVCSLTRATLGRTLNCCSRCKLAYYCSKECQVSAWKNGHKQACRKPGQIKVGDIMKIARVHPAADGQLVRIVGTDPNRPGRWMVQLLIVSQCPPSSYATENLVHIRPAK